MIIESSKLFFALNPKRSVTNAFGFIKKDMFELFSNNSDWCVCIQFDLPTKIHNLISVFALEGIDLSISIITANHLHFTFNDENKRQDIDINISKLNLFQNVFALSYNHTNNCYEIFINGNKIIEVNLKQRLNLDIMQIKLFSICRQFAFSGSELADQNIKVHNAFISKSTFNVDSPNKYFSNKIHERDHYDRTIIKEELRENIYALYDFNECLNGKIWDLTTNNNFLFTSLDLKERVGYSAI